MKQKKNIKKILVRMLCGVIVAGVLVAESYFMITKEKEHQEITAGEIYNDVILNLDMIKIAVQTGDGEMFEDNLHEAERRLGDVDDLFMMRKLQEDYVRRIDAYLDLLSSRRELMSEVGAIKTETIRIKTELTNSYSNKDGVTRDEMKAASAKIAGLKINTDGYKNEEIKKIAESINSMLDGFAGKAGELAGCIDVCYKDKIAGISNSLKESFQTFVDKTEGFNLAVEEKFSFGEIDEIKSNKPKVE